MFYIQTLHSKTCFNVSHGPLIYFFKLILVSICQYCNLCMCFIIKIWLSNKSVILSGPNWKQKLGWLNHDYIKIIDFFKNIFFFLLCSQIHTSELMVNLKKIRNFENLKELKKLTFFGLVIVEPKSTYLGIIWWSWKWIIQ